MKSLTEFESFFDSSPLDFMRTVPFEKIIFDQRCQFLCKYGCKNYNRKFCCPPDSLQLANKIQEKKYKWALLAATTTSLPETISVYKKRFLNRKKELEIQKISTILHEFFMKNEINHVVLTGGSCKKCQICSKIYNQECKKPALRLTSMEAVGIDCQKTLTSAGFDFEMPAIGSINRCASALFDDDDFSSISWKKNDSYQRFKKVNKKMIQSTCDLLLHEHSKMFESIELIPISEIDQDNFGCERECIHYSKNFACPPYSDRINLNLWDHCVLWKWKKNQTKCAGYNNALKTIHNSFFSLGLYFAFSIRDCHCDECPVCEYGLHDSPMCNFRKIMSPSMQSQGINPNQFEKGSFGLEFI